MQTGRLQTRIFLVGLFLVLLVIAAAGWVIRPFAAIATLGAGLVEARSRGATTSRFARSTRSVTY